jgi:hypothetical protein
MGSGLAGAEVEEDEVEFGGGGGEFGEEVVGDHGRLRGEK